MTNREKFEEVFGITIKKEVQCQIFELRQCKQVEWQCSKCPFYDFWNREYAGQASRKGYWIIDDKEGSRIWKCHCSECNKDPQEDFIQGTENWWVNKLPDFCPHCGVDMEDDNGDNK